MFNIHWDSQWDMTVLSSSSSNMFSINEVLYWEPLWARISAIQFPFRLAWLKELALTSESRTTNILSWCSNLKWDHTWWLCLPFWMCSAIFRTTSESSSMIKGYQPCLLAMIKPCINPSSSESLLVSCPMNPAKSLRIYPCGLWRGL